MAERLQNAAFNNVKLIPNGTPKHGDGLLYIGDNPLLVYSDGEPHTGENKTSGAGWFLNQVGVSGAPSNATPTQQNKPSDSDKPSDQLPGSGLRQAVYPIDTLRQLATSVVKTSVKRSTGEPVKQTPNRHEQYTNMGMFVEIKSKSGTKQITKKGDIIFAVDDTLFNNENFAKLSNYVIGWNEMNGNVSNLPFLVYSGDHNSNKIAYKYYNSANKTIFNLKCKDDKCANFNEDGYGTPKNPVVLTLCDKTEIETKINALTASTAVQRLITKPLNVKMSYKEPNALNFTFDYTQYEYNAGMVIQVKFNALDVLDEDDIILASDVNGQLRGLSIVRPDRKAFMMVYSNTLTEADMSLSVVKQTDNGPYSKDMIYDLSPDADFVFVNDEYREFVINVGRANKFLGAGWAWFSNYLTNSESQTDPTIRSISDILTNKGKRPQVLASIDQIKTQGKFAKRDEDGNWIGTLDINSNSDTLLSFRSYKLYMNRDTTWIYDAYPLTENVPLYLSEQWNWIGYPFKGSKPVSQVLSSTVLENADYIKGQKNFSTIESGVLDLPFNMERTKGYKIHMDNPVQGEMYNVVDETNYGRNLPQVPDSAIYTFAKVTSLQTGRTLEEEVNNVANDRMDVRPWHDMTAIFGEGASWKINNNNSALFTLANGESISVTGDVRNWIYTNNDDFNTFNTPFVKIINGFERKLVGMCIKQVGYIITGTTVSDVKLTLDFNVLFEDESLDANKNIIMSLSSLGVGPIVFSNSSSTASDVVVEPTVFTVSTDDKLRVRDESNTIISSITGVMEDQLSSSFKQNRKEKLIGTNWSLWYPSTQVAGSNKDLIFTYLNNGIYYEQKNILGNVILQVPSGDLSVDELNMNSMMLGNLWSIKPANGSLIFYFRNTISQKYTAQSLNNEVSLFNPRLDGVLEIKDDDDNVLSLITPFTDNTSEIFDGDNYGNIDYEERRLGVSDWSIWYPDTTDINNTVGSDGELIIPENEDKELIFTYNNYIQTLTIPTVTSPDVDSLNEKSMILGHLWAIEPKAGGLTFYFRESTTEFYEAQIDIQSARFLTNITKAKYISKVTV